MRYAITWHAQRGGQQGDICQHLHSLQPGTTPVPFSHLTSQSAIQIIHVFAAVNDGDSDRQTMTGMAIGCGYAERGKTR